MPLLGVINHRLLPMLAETSFVTLCPNILSPGCLKNVDIFPLARAQPGVGCSHDVVAAQR